MRLDTFLKELFSQESVKGYNISRLDVNVGISSGGKICIFDDVPSKITIVPKGQVPEDTEKEIELLKKALMESQEHILTLSRKLLEPPLVLKKES